MTNAMPIIITVLAFAVLGALLLGLLTMARGGNAARKYGNKLMWIRVGLQGLAVLAILLLFAMTLI
jgi:uncharacterized integral membrane protein